MSPTADKHGHGWSDINDPFTAEQTTAALDAIGHEYSARSTDALATFGRTGVLANINVDQNTGAVTFRAASGTTVTFAGIDNTDSIRDLTERFEPNTFMYRCGNGPGRVWIVAVSAQFTCTIIASIAKN